MFDKRTFQPYVSAAALCSTYSTVPSHLNQENQSEKFKQIYCIPFVVFGNSMLPYFSRAGFIMSIAAEVKSQSNDWSRGPTELV